EGMTRAYVGAAIRACQYASSAETSHVPVFYPFQRFDGNLAGRDSRRIQPASSGRSSDSNTTIAGAGRTLRSPATQAPGNPSLPLDFFEQHAKAFSLGRIDGLDEPYPAVEVRAKIANSI